MTATTTAARLDLRLDSRDKARIAKAAALRGMELKCDAIIKATKVDGIYDKDPNKYSDAVKYDSITYDETLARHLGVMDATAFALVRDNNVPIIVCRMFGGDICRAVTGESVGTIVQN